MYNVRFFGWLSLFLIFNAVDFAVLAKPTKELCTKPDNTLESGGIAYQCNVCWCIGNGVPLCTSIDCNRIPKPLWGTLSITRPKKRFFSWLWVAVTKVIAFVAPIVAEAVTSFVSGFFHRLGERAADYVVDTLTRTTAMVTTASRKVGNNCAPSLNGTGTLCKVNLLLNKESAKPRTANKNKAKEVLCKVSEIMDAAKDIDCTSLRKSGKSESDYCSVIELLKKEDIVCTKSAQLKISKNVVMSIREIVKKAVEYLAVIGY